MNSLIHPKEKGSIKENIKTNNLVWANTTFQTFMMHCVLSSGLSDSGVLSSILSSVLSGVSLVFSLVFSPVFSLVPSLVF